METTKKDVEHLAELAKLELTEEEKELYASQLKKIFSWIKELNGAEAPGVRPRDCAQAPEPRPDLPEQFADREAILRLAPRREENFIKAPKAIE